MKKERKKERKDYHIASEIKIDNKIRHHYSFYHKTVKTGYKTIMLVVSPTFQIYLCQFVSPWNCQFYTQVSTISSFHC